MIETFILLTSVILDPIAATIFLWALLYSKNKYMSVRFVRVIAAICCIGLYGQAYRSGLYITTGVAPRDDELVWWFGKDLGLSLFAVFLVWESFSNRKLEA